MTRRARRVTVTLALVAGAALGLNVFAHLGYPLLWADEAETAVFGQRVLVYGYPKIHHEGRVLYLMNLPLEVGRKESIDAYIGTPWAHFYVAALGELFARRAADVHERTARLRAPFAVAGVAGLLLVAAALAPYAATGAARAGFVAAYLATATLSTSLVLHLREARYYSLVVLEVGLLILLHLRRIAGPPGRRLALDAGVGGLLVGMFLTFYPICAAAMAALLADALRRAWATAGPWRVRLRSGATEVWPVAAALVGIAPLLAFFETAHVAAAFSARLQFTWTAFAENVGALVWHLLRYDALAPAVLCQAAWWVAAADRRHRDALDEAGRRAVAFAWTFAIVHAVVAAYNPVLWGRYFVAMTPVLVGVACLSAAQALRGRPGRASRVPSALLIATSCLLFLGLQSQLLLGRLDEIRAPVRGPLDYAIPFIQQRYEDPEKIVVVTNYEAPSFMYYLGCVAAEVPRPGDDSPLPAVVPDVVVPRRWWGNAPRLQSYLRGGQWFEQRFPVVDVPFNNIPEIANVSRRLRVFHHFRTPETEDPMNQFVLYWRPWDAGRHSGLGAAPSVRRAS